MDLEFLLVGVAKNNKDDLRELYKETAARVFGLSLAITKDVDIATEILAETYKRIVSLAYLFNTEMSAEYWLLDMAKNLSVNALHDSEVRKKLEFKNQVNLSFLLMELVNNSINDRSAIIVLNAMSDLNNRDISKLLWYKTASCKNEYNRGINNLVKKFETLDKNDIPAVIKDSISNICPDVWNKIISTEDGPLAHISHEELNLESDELIYTEFDKEKALEEKNTTLKKKRTRLIVGLVAVAIILVSGISLTVHRNLIKKGPSEDEVVIDVQYGNKLSMVEINDKLYFQNNKNENHLWCYDLKTNKSKEIVDSEIKELITDGDKLFYRNLDNGKIYSVDFDGSNNKRLTETSGTSIVYNNGLIYFSCADGIKSIKPDGTEEQLIVNLAENSEDYKYFTNQDLTPYRYKMVFSPEDQLYFSAGAGKGLFYITESDNKSIVETISNLEIYTFAFHDNIIYYDYKILDENLMGTIYLHAIDLETKMSYDVNNIVMGTGAFCIKDSTLYYDGIHKNVPGIYTLDLKEKNPEPQLLINKRASDMYINNNKLYIYFPGTKEAPGKYLEAVSLKDTSETVSILK